MDRLWGSISSFVCRRATATLVGVVVAVVVLGIGATQLRFDTSQNGLIGKDSQAAKDNVRYQRAFGGEAMLILLSAGDGGKVENLFTAENLPRLRRLERELRATGEFSSVIGPLDALEFAANQLTVGTEIFADAIANAQAAGNNAEVTRLQQLEATEQGRVTDLINAGKLSAADILGGPSQQSFRALRQSLDDPDVVEFLLRDADGEIRPIMRDNFPNNEHGVIIARLQGNLDINEIGEGADAASDVVARNPIPGFEALATGSPVLLKDINDYLQGGLTTLGALALGVMVVILFFVFRVRWRLLPLVVVALGAVATFGIMGIFDIPLTVVTISGLPIVIGLAVDFSIQVQARFEEEVSVDGDATAAMRRMYVNLAPALTIAMLAAVIGFFAIQVSRVPIIRDFGVMLDIAVLMLYLVVITVPPASLMLREHRHPTAPHPWGRGVIEGLVRRLAHSFQRVLLPVVVIGAVLVVGGFAVEGRFDIQTDPEKWVPQDSQVVDDLDRLRDGAGFSTELGMFIEADDVTRTDVVSWMYRYGARQVRKHPDELLRATSLPAINAAVTEGAPPDRSQFEDLLEVAPRPFRVAFISPDRTQANLIFPITNIPLQARGELLDEMVADLDPPEGVTATPSGLVVIGVELVNALEANREVMTFLSLGLVVVWLAICFRNFWKVLMPVTPVLIAVGASSLVVYVLGLELSPLTAVSGPLIIAVCTEFSVLIMARYVEERARGRTPDEAVDVGAVRIGRAFVASGLTLIGGFLVLAASPFPLLRDFGIIVSLNAVVALLSALFIMPPMLMWVDKHPRIGGFRPGPPEEYERPPAPEREPTTARA